MSYDPSQFLWVSGLAVWFWLRICHEIANRTLPGSTLIWRLDQGWRICFQGGSLVWLASRCWLLRRGCSSFLCGPLHRAAWVSSQHHNMVAVFPQSQRSKRKQYGSHNGLYALALGFIYHDFHKAYWSPRSALFNVRGATQGHEYQRWGSISEAGYHAVSAMMNKRVGCLTSRVC